MAGGTDRRGVGTRQRQARDRLHARLLLRRIPDDGRDRPHSRPRPVARFAGESIVMIRHALIGALLVLVAPASANAQSVAEFYRGKTIEILIGGAVGGGYDLAG